jgi:hypothetical protein
LKNSINVSNSPNGKSENVEIVLDQDNNNTYIIFLDNKAGEIGLYIVASDNNGETFSAHLLLNISNIL